MLSTLSKVLGTRSTVLFLCLFSSRGLINFSTYNPGYNILEFFNVLVQVRFTKVKMKVGIWYNKLGI